MNTGTKSTGKTAIDGHVKGKLYLSGTQPNVKLLSKFNYIHSLVIKHLGHSLGIEIHYMDQLAA